VSKNGLILTSLVGALPGAFLTYLMVMAFVNFAGGPYILHKVLCVMALLIGLLLMAMPVGILVLGGPKPEKSPAKKEDKDKAKSEDAGVDEDSEVVEEDDAVVAEDDAVIEESGTATDDNLVVEDTGTDEFAMTGELVTDDVSAEEDFAEAEEDFIEIEEDEAPKKGKKKK
jgi:hypothetical protein